MQNIPATPATPDQLKHIQERLSQYPQMGQGVCNLVRSIASYDGASAVRYIEFAITTRHLSLSNTKEKTASHHAIAC